MFNGYKIQVLEYWYALLCIVKCGMYGFVRIAATISPEGRIIKHLKAHGQAQGTLPMHADVLPK